MSLSFRSLGVHLRAVGTASAWGAAALLLAAPAAHAQQLLFNPRVETTVEWDSNRLLTTRHNPPTGEWFQGLLAADLSRTTVRSSLDVRSSFIAQKSTLKGLDTFEALVGGKYTFLTERSEYDVVAQYHRQDAFNSEYGQAFFDPLNPNGPSTVGTGQVVIGDTRQNYQISPSLSHAFTERFQAEFDASFLAVRYSIQVPQVLVSFNAPSVSANAVWAVTQRGRLAIGPYYTEYDPVNSLQEGTLKSRSYGANIGYRYQTTRTTNSSVTLKLGRDEQDQFVGPRIGTNTWGLEWKGTYVLETSELQFALGRFLEPSSVGGEVGLYQIRAQYIRQFSATLKGSIAARVSREQGIGQLNIGNRDRSYGDASLTKTVSREFFVTGGYRWLVQRLPVGNSAGTGLVAGPTAVNNGVYLTIGWHPIESR
jgi:hypothetical protein